jgi:hypothetical protein
MPSAEIFALVADSTADLVVIRHKRANLSLTTSALVLASQTTKLSMQKYHQGASK